MSFSGRIGVVFAAANECLVGAARDGVCVPDEPGRHFEPYILQIAFRDEGSFGPCGLVDHKGGRERVRVRACLHVGCAIRVPRSAGGRSPMPPTGGRPRDLFILSDASPFDLPHRAAEYPPGPTHGPRSSPDGHSITDQLEKNAGVQVRQPGASAHRWGYLPGWAAPRDLAQSCVPSHNSRRLGPTGLVRRFRDQRPVCPQQPLLERCARAPCQLALDPRDI